MNDKRQPTTTTPVTPPPLPTGEHRVVPFNTLRQAANWIRAINPDGQIDAFAPDPAAIDAIVSSMRAEKFRLPLFQDDPLLARPIKGADGALEVLNGNMRRLAIQLAVSKKLLPENPPVSVNVRAMTDDEALSVQFRGFNRSDMRPSQKARALAYSHAKMGKSAETLADDTAQSKGHVAQLIQIATLPAAVLEQWDVKARGATHPVLYHLSRMNATTRERWIPLWLEGSKKGEPIRLPELDDNGAEVTGGGADGEADGGEGRGTKPKTSAKGGRAAREDLPIKDQKLRNKYKKIKALNIHDQAKAAINFLLSKPGTDWEVDDLFLHVAPVAAKKAGIGVDPEPAAE